jgi:hypothetical protein
VVSNHLLPHQNNLCEKKGENCILIRFQEASTDALNAGYFHALNAGLLACPSFAAIPELIILSITPPRDIDDHFQI